MHRRLRRPTCCRPAGWGIGVELRAVSDEASSFVGSLGPLVLGYRVGFLEHLSYGRLGHLDSGRLGAPSIDRAPSGTSISGARSGTVGSASASGTASLAPLGRTDLEPAWAPRTGAARAVRPGAARAPRRWPQSPGRTLQPSSACDGVNKLTMDLPALGAAFWPNKPATLVIGVLRLRLRGQGHHAAQSRRLRLSPEAPMLCQPRREPPLEAHHPGTPRERLPTGCPARPLRQARRGPHSPAHPPGTPRERLTTQCRPRALCQPR